MKNLAGRVNQKIHGIGDALSEFAVRAKLLAESHCDQQLEQAIPRATCSACHGVALGGLDNPVCDCHPFCSLRRAGWPHLRSGGSNFQGHRTTICGHDRRHRIPAERLKLFDSVPNSHCPAALFAINQHPHA